MLRDLPIVQQRRASFLLRSSLAHRLDLQEAAPACLAKVAPKDLCGWEVKAGSQAIYCSGGRVDWIYLENCGLASLHASIGNLTALTRLDLSSNLLTSLPASIGGLTALTTAVLKNNGLVLLPDSIGDLTALQGLGLSSNGLTSLPTSIGKLRGLKELDVRDNYLGSLPDTIGDSA